MDATLVKTNAEEIRGVARWVLEVHWAYVDRLATALVERKTLTGAEVIDLLGALIPSELRRPFVEKCDTCGSSSEGLLDSGSAGMTSLCVACYHKAAEEWLQANTAERRQLEARIRDLTQDLVRERTERASIADERDADRRAFNGAREGLEGDKAKLAEELSLVKAVADERLKGMAAMTLELEHAESVVKAAKKLCAVLYAGRESMPYAEMNALSEAVARV